MMPRTSKALALVALLSPSQLTAAPARWELYPVPVRGLKEQLSVSLHGAILVDRSTGRAWRCATRITKERPQGVVIGPNSCSGSPPDLPTDPDLVAVPDFGPRGHGSSEPSGPLFWDVIWFVNPTTGAVKFCHLQTETLPCQDFTVTNPTP